MYIGVPIKAARRKEGRYVFEVHVGEYSFHLARYGFACDTVVATMTPTPYSYKDIYVEYVPGTSAFDTFLLVLTSELGGHNEEMSVGDGHLQDRFQGATVHVHRTSSPGGFHTNTLVMIYYFIFVPPLQTASL